MNRSRVTIRDVASQAGVSRQTVSRVINQTDNVAEDTRARVEAAIANLGYRPQVWAQSLATGMTGLFACIVPNLTDYTFASLVHGAELGARAAGAFLLSATADNDKMFSGLIDELVMSGRVDGLLVINPFVDERYSYLPADFPVVLAGARPRHGQWQSVALNDEDVGYQATKHLLALGHRQIATVTGPLTEDCAQDRRYGYQQALQEAGIPLRADWLLTGDWSAASGYACWQRFGRSRELPTAVFAQNDQMAIGVLRAAYSQGIQIPQQLSIIGVDDIPMAAYATPALTTLRQDFHAIGQQAMQLLIAQAQNQHGQIVQKRLPAQLIVRESTAPIVF
ncbi:MAG TPA: LacI family DNA-binding transcriptional regulator [Anaerolineae bacterium]|nr:LacI family DNA-binding transcriptional regulator [Anaerolineae bacterium]